MPSITITSDSQEDLDKIKAFAEGLDLVRIEEPTIGPSYQAVQGVLELKGIWEDSGRPNGFFIKILMASDKICISVFNLFLLKSVYWLWKQSQ